MVSRAVAAHRDQAGQHRYLLSRGAPFTADLSWFGAGSVRHTHECDVCGRRAEVQAVLPAYQTRPGAVSVFLTILRVMADTMADLSSG